MYCGSCTYWENDICYRKGKRINYNNNICEDFVIMYINRNGLEEELKK